MNCLLSLPFFQILDMAGNQLTAIPFDLPESLEYLYLQNNKITTVPEDAFDSTPNIKGIYLRFVTKWKSNFPEMSPRCIELLERCSVFGSFLTEQLVTIRNSFCNSVSKPGSYM